MESSDGSKGDVDVDTEDDVTLAFFLGPGLLLLAFSFFLNWGGFVELSLPLLKLPFLLFVLVAVVVWNRAPLLPVLSLRLPGREEELGLSLGFTAEVELDFLFRSPTFCC